MQNIDAEEILDKLQKDETEEISNLTDKDFENCNAIVSEVEERLLCDKITIVSHEDLQKNEIIGFEESQRRVSSKIDNFESKDDFKYSKTRVKSVTYDDSEKGFKVYYPKNKNSEMLKIDVKIVKSVSDFIKHVIYPQTEIDSDTKMYYRGHGDWKYELLPGIYRNGNKKILERESQYIHEIVSMYPRYFTECKSSLDYLAVLQHNGFPTRLLDFTENPLVALYMACISNKKSEADVISIKVKNENIKLYDSDTVSLLSNLAWFDDGFYVNHDSDKREFNEKKEVLRFIHQIKNEKSYFEAEIEPKDLNKIIFVKPQHTFERIAQQSGLFAIFGMDETKQSHPNIEKNQGVVEIIHYIVPYELKKRIISELARLNINQATIYCDLEHVAQYYIAKSNDDEIDRVIKENRLMKEKQDQELYESVFGK